MLLLGVGARDNHRRRLLLHLKSFHVSRSLLFLDAALPLGHFLEHLPCCFIRTKSDSSGAPGDAYLDFVVPERQVAEPSRWKKVNAKKWGITRDMIPPSSLKILNTLRVRGFESYLVGGCVRDLILNRHPKDFDIITTANLVQVKEEFKKKTIIIGQRFPICRVHMKGTFTEVSSFETVSRHAEEKERVIFSKMSDSCDEKDFIRWRDSMHRDFTINSLFYDPSKDVIYDYSNGIADLKTLKLRTLIPARLSFQEDCARILRGLRIAGRLGLTISKETATAMYEYSSSVSNLDKFRMMMEMNYMLSYGAANSTILLLQRFNLLNRILPFHAAYLDEQAAERSSTSCMMMKLFSNLDQLFSCDQPCPQSLWVGLLAFHQALVTKPQDGLAVWTFASVLYHGSWKKGIRFARENAKVQVAPEISGFCNGQLNAELTKQVTQMAHLVLDSVYALTDAECLSKYLSIFRVSPSPSTVFIPRAIGRKATELFGMLLDDTKVQKKERLTFDLDYRLLLEKDVHETRFALGKIILETLGHENLEGMEVPRKDQVIIEETVPRVLKEEQDIGEKESEILIKGQAFEKLLKEEQEIEANGYPRLSAFVKCLVTVKDGILASLRGQRANGDGEREVVDEEGYTTMSQYGKTTVNILDKKGIRKVMDIVKEDMETVEENKSIDCDVVKEDREQTLVKMEDSEHQLQQEKKEDHTLQHDLSREKTDQFKAALTADKVIGKLCNKRTLVSVKGPNPKKLKGQKLSKLETCAEQETEEMKVVAVLKNASPKLAENKMQLSDVVISANRASSRTEGTFSKRMKLLRQVGHLPQPSIDDEFCSAVETDDQDPVRKSAKKIGKVKRKAIETQSMDERTEQEKLATALRSLSGKQQAQVKKPAKKVGKGEPGELHEGKTVECATSLGKKLNKDDRVKKEKKKDNHSQRQSVARKKTEKPNYRPCSFVEEEGDRRDNHSPHREDVRNKIENTKEEHDPPSSCNKGVEKDCSNKLLHEMLTEKTVWIKSTSADEKKARVPLSKLFQR